MLKIQFSLQEIILARYGSDLRFDILVAGSTGGLQHAWMAAQQTCGDAFSTSRQITKVFAPTLFSLNYNGHVPLTATGPSQRWIRIRAGHLAT